MLKEIKTGSIYKISFPDGKFYIGQSVNPKKRFKTHLHAAKMGSLYPVHCKIREFNIENISFKILEVVSIEKIIDIEREYIKKEASDLCLNISSNKKNINKENSSKKNIKKIKNDDFTEQAILGFKKLAKDWEIVANNILINTNFSNDEHIERYVEARLDFLCLNCFIASRSKENFSSLFGYEIYDYLNDINSTVIGLSDYKVKLKKEWIDATNKIFSNLGKSVKSSDILTSRLMSIVNATLETDQNYFYSLPLIYTHFEEYYEKLKHLKK